MFVHWPIYPNCVKPIHVVELCFWYLFASLFCKWLVFECRFDLFGVLRATLDKGLRTKSLETNWIFNWTFFHIKKTHFLITQWMCLKAWGSIWRSNIKNVWLACERIRLTFDIYIFSFSKFIFWFFFTYNGWT